MAGPLLLGLDVGTTAVKAGVFDARTGRALATTTVRLSVRAGADGAREQAVGGLERAVRQACGRLRDRLGRAWGRLGGVGLAAQGGSAILADRETGRAHTPMQLWNDTRPLRHLPQIAARKPASYWRRLSYLDGPGAGLARLRWLQERYPSLFRGGTIYVGAGEYLFFKLTGQWRQDAGNALQIGCYDARQSRLAAEPLGLVGVGLDFVAPMRQGHQSFPLSRRGAVFLGLPAGVPVVGPYIDHEAGYLSAVGCSDRPLQCSLGTAWVGNFVLESGPPPAGGLNLVLPSPLGKGRLVLRVMRAGNVTWDWALGALVSADRRGALAKAAGLFRRRLLPPEGLIALPWLTRPNPLAPDVAGAGGFLGVGGHVCSGDLLRAVAAGMCFELARVLAPARRPTGFDSVVLGGGASRAECFRRLLAGLFDPLPVFVARDETCGARGAVYAFSASAARCPVRAQARPPATLRASILRQYDLYCRACEALSPVVSDSRQAPAPARAERKRR